MTPPGTPDSPEETPDTPPGASDPVGPGGGRRLPASYGSLARGASAPLPGTLFALALTGGMTLGPGKGREVLFGRNRPEVRPGAGWTDKRVEHLVNGVRTRLSRDGVPWLTREELGEPVGYALNDQLIRALLAPTTLVPMDLALIDAA
ncbi:hypothetical protein OG496_29830 [Streptomyces sp. NBC_00988]|uniref:hypothetical protein n=1 Tax=Streptomyces sp. NBC_00988 TaxID=2903704 RepID=UPI0038689C57|nr:hypothetical protein OG496_29830 [Streptomyces sp. NBC_00988]